MLPDERGRSRPHPRIIYCSEKIPFFEESFESATYEGLGFTNLLNQLLATALS
jgi:hypothetical protein